MNIKQELLKIANLIASSDEDLLTEVGVPYSRKKQRGMKEFKYKWESKGKSGITSVYTENKGGFKKLLDHWNRDKRWNYEEV